VPRSDARCPLYHMKLPELLQAVDGESVPQIGIGGRLTTPPLPHHQNPAAARLWILLTSQRHLPAAAPLKRRWVCEEGQRLCRPISGALCLPLRR